MKTRPPLMPTRGRTEWEATKIAAAVSKYGQASPHEPPMVATRGLSPEFLELAIRLDEALAVFRDRFGRAHLLRRHCERQGTPMTIPELAAIERAGDEAQQAVFKLITEVESSKPVTTGDRRLKRRVVDLRGDNWLRQLDWLYDLYEEDRRERYGK